jgi:hypothetical protein
MNDDDGDNRLSTKLAMTQADRDMIVNFIQNNSAELFKIPQIRAMITLNRLSQIDDSQVKVYEKPDDAVLDFTIGHNLAQIKSPSALLRPSMLINPLCSIDFIYRHLRNLKVLTVGPRNECEIFTLIAGGFLPENITALDLLSYSKFIDLGDMHEMPYEDDRFDVVLLPWVIGYSNDIPKAIDETMRVAKPGAYIGIGGECNPEDRDKETGEYIQRVWHRTDSLLEMFGDQVNQVILRQDVHPALLGHVQHVTVIFTLNGDLGFRMEEEVGFKAG